MTMLTHPTYSYSGDNLKGDVSYDAFITANPDADPTDDHAFEVMVWLAAYDGYLPIGGGENGNPTEKVQIGGETWTLFNGQNTNNGNTWTVYSFMAPTTTNHYQGDLNEFFKYLTDQGKIPADYYLQVAQGGTEAVSGQNAVFSVKSYTMGYNI